MKKMPEKNMFLDTQLVVAFAFVTFMVALTVPAKVALAYPTLAMPDVSYTAFNSLSSAIAAAPAFSLFALGFISAMLFLGVVWDKYSFEKYLPLYSPSHAHTKKGRVKRKNSGFISSDLISFSILSILMVVVLTSPVFI